MTYDIQGLLIINLAWKKYKENVKAAIQIKALPKGHSSAGSVLA